MIRDRETRCKGQNAKKCRFFAGLVHISQGVVNVSWFVNGPRTTDHERANFSRPFFQHLSSACVCVSHRRTGSAMLAKKRRMGELQQQLAELRRRVEKIDRKYAGGPPIAAPQHFATTPRPAHVYIEEWLSGQEVGP